jgi:polyphosphate glucokinase
LQSGPQALQFLLMTTQIRKAPSSAPRAVKKTSNPITISIDIGGSGLKAMLLDAAGKPVSERVRLATPAVPTPRSVLR